jgi:hypothetical protein
MKILNKKTLLFIFFILVILLYSLIQSQKIIEGPIIKIHSPINGETYINPLISIKGQTLNTTSIQINNNPIFTDKDGFFDEKLLLFNGYNIIILEGESRFGKKTRKKIEVICRCQKN